MPETPSISPLWLDRVQATVDQAHEENWGGKHRNGFCEACADAYLVAQHTIDQPIDQITVVNTKAILTLMVECVGRLARREDPQPGDLVVEVTHRSLGDPDAIGWLIAHDVAPYGADDPSDGSAPMREVWDIRPLNPHAQLQTIGGTQLQRWENALFIKVPDTLQARIMETIGEL